jgi:hypothetical protein
MSVVSDIDSSQIKVYLVTTSRKKPQILTGSVLEAEIRSCLMITEFLL